MPFMVQEWKKSSISESQKLFKLPSAVSSEGVEVEGEGKNFCDWRVDVFTSYVIKSLWKSSLYQQRLLE